MGSSRWGVEASWVDALQKRLGGEGSQAHHDDDQRRRGQRRQKVQPERRRGPGTEASRVGGRRGMRGIGLLEAGFSVCVSLSGHCSARRILPAESRVAGQADRTLGPAHEAQGSPWAQRVSAQGLLLPGGLGGQGAVSGQTSESLGCPSRSVTGGQTCARHRRAAL